MPLDNHVIADRNGDDSGRRIGENLGVDAVCASREDVDPLGAAVFHHEDQRAPVALDDGAGGDEAAVLEARGFESHIGVHTRAEGAAAG